MIEVKNLKLEDNIVQFSYKTELNDFYKTIKYNIKTDEYEPVDIDEYELKCIYHAIKEIKRKIKNNELIDKFIKIWY